MLSLNVFSRPEHRELLTAYRRSFACVIQALLQQAPAGDESDHASFRESMSGVSTQMTSSDSRPPDILMAAGAAATAIQEYNRLVVGAVRARRLELEAVVAMLTQTMSEIGAGSDRSLDRLQSIEAKLQKSEEIFDLRDLRQQMSDCLAAVREEAADRKQESDRLLAGLQAAARQSEHVGPPVPDVPLALLEPEGIERKILETAAGQTGFFVAMLVIDHLAPVIARFGESAGSRLADFCAEQARVSFSKAALGIFVWKRAACVAVLDGSGGFEWLKRMVAHEAQQRRSLSLEVKDREVLLHVTYSHWVLLPSAGASLTALAEKLNHSLGSANGVPKAS